jgi:LPXTG-motif cell wall-anchored protein
VRGFTGSSLKVGAAFLLSGSLLTGAVGMAFAQAQTFNVTIDGTPRPFVWMGLPTTVRAGAPITINARNVGPAGDTSAPHTHNIAIEAPGGVTIPSPVPNFTGGQSATLNFAALTPGTYTFYCPVGQHRANGLSTTFTVVAGAAALPATGGFAVPGALAAAGAAAGAAGFVLRRRRA